MKRIDTRSRASRSSGSGRDAHPFKPPSGPTAPTRSMTPRAGSAGRWGRLVLGRVSRRKNLSEHSLRRAGQHPILRIEELLDPRRRPASAPERGMPPVLLGQPLVGWKPDDKPNPDKKAIPIAWTGPTGAGRRPRACYPRWARRGVQVEVSPPHRQRLLLTMGMGRRSMPEQRRLVGPYDPGPVGGKGLRSVKPSGSVERTSQRHSFTAIALLAGAQSDGWVSLFDGKSLDGWGRERQRHVFRAEDGCILGKTTRTAPTRSSARRRTGDFERKFEVKVDALNSGVQIRSASKPGLTTRPRPRPRVRSIKQERGLHLAKASRPAGCTAATSAARGGLPEGRVEPLSRARRGRNDQDVDQRHPGG